MSVARKDPPERPSGPRWGRVLKLVGTFLLGFAAMALISAGVLILGFRRLAETRYEAALAAADRMDPNGWSLEALQGRRISYQHPSNDAPLLDVVLELMPEGWPDAPQVDLEEQADLSTPPPADDLANLRGIRLVSSLQDWPPEVRLSSTMRDALSRELGPLQLTGLYSRSLASAKGGRLPVEFATVFLDTDFPHLNEMRSLGQFLALEATLQAEQDDAPGAVDSVRAMLGVSRTVSDEPFINSQLVRTILHRRAVDTAERVLAQGVPPADALRDLQADLAFAEAAPLLPIAMEAERAGYDDLLARLERGEFEARIEGHRGVRGAMDAVAHWLYRRSYYQFNRAVMLEANNRATDLARRPIDRSQAAWEEHFRRIREEAPWIDRNLADLTMLIMPVHRPAVQAFARDQARLRVAQAAIAAERYRLDHGEWPASLSAMVPEYLDAVPADPYVEATIQLRQLSNGLVVYSVGANQVDDEGRIDRQDDQPGTDIGFRLWDLDDRRQPSSMRRASASESAIARGRSAQGAVDRPRPPRW